MQHIEQYISIPIGSLATVDATEEKKYLNHLNNMPASLIRLVLSPKTGSYLHGLTKIHQLTKIQTPRLAFTVLRVAVGEIPMAKLAALLSAELQLANDRAQKLAAEIERDLFAPVALEMGQFLQTKEAEKRSSASTAATNAGARNVLNLKAQPLPPAPPPIPPVLRNGRI